MSKKKELNSKIIKEELIKNYPARVAKKRAQQIVVNDPACESNQILANSRSIPGILTQRGCAYAGCKGVVLGPVRDILNLTHGPIGCGFYSWLTRRNQTKTNSDTEDNFIPYCFTTDMQDENIIFGGEKKLKKAIEEAYEIFKPKSMAIFATCPVGLIGDDIHAIAREMSGKFGINIFALSCEGYKGVSQSAGHHIANNQLFKHVIGKSGNTSKEKFKISLLGEYNIGGDSFVIEDLFKRCGFNLVSTFSGNASYEQIASTQTADLNLVMCHRSINYIADMIEKKYGIPWIKVNFIGANSTVKSLRKIAEYFEDKDLIERVEKVILDELNKISKVQEEIKKRTLGKTAMLFVGGSRAHHYQDLFKEIGIITTAAGYEFAHRDDYEGREVLPTIKTDADSKNIEELTVLADLKEYKLRKTEDEKNELEKKGFKFKDYEGMMKDMKTDTFVIDDINHYEMEKLIEKFKPDIFCAGIKEKYVIQKMGIPLKQLHSYDYGGPYAGFDGAINFYKDVDRMINTKVWSLIKAPWQKYEPIPAVFVNP